MKPVFVVKSKRATIAELEEKKIKDEERLVIGALKLVCVLLLLFCLRFFVFTFSSQIRIDIIPKMGGNKHVYDVIYIK
jgi:hypothetical protein